MRQLARDALDLPMKLPASVADGPSGKTGPKKVTA